MALVAVILTKVIYQGLELTFVLHPERLYHFQSVPVRLPGYQPVDVGIKVKGYTDRLIPVQVCIHQTGRLLNLIELVFQTVKITEVGSIVLMPFSHR